MSNTKIQVRKNGPLRIEGTDIEIVDAEGRRFDLAGRTVISLCRCGHSQNKPFCDGSARPHGVRIRLPGPRAAAAGAEAGLGWKRQVVGLAVPRGQNAQADDPDAEEHEPAGIF